VVGLYSGGGGAYSRRFTVIIITFIIMLKFIMVLLFKDKIPIAPRLMLCISSHVNAAAHCMLGKHADTFTHILQSISESRL
jgi:hypothetical protein